MAEVKADGSQAVTLTLVDRLYVKQAIELYRKSLIRSRLKEAPGSEIAALRTKEIDGLGVLLSRF